MNGLRLNNIKYLLCFMLTIGLMLFLLVACKPKGTQSEGDVSEASSFEAEEQVQAQPGNNDDQGQNSVQPAPEPARNLTPQSPFPLENWRIQYNPVTSVLPSHQRLGPMLDLIAQDNESLVFNETTELLLGWPELDDNQIYAPSKEALKVKLQQSWADFEDLIFTIGKPNVIGNTCEVPVLIENNQRVVRFYWYYDEQWYLEEIDL